MKNEWNWMGTQTNKSRGQSFPPQEVIDHLKIQGKVQRLIMPSKTTYKNEHGEVMKMEYSQILTIDHDDIGMVYCMPDGRFYTLGVKDIGIKHPETDEPLSMGIYEQVVLSQAEITIIQKHKGD